MTPTIPAPPLLIDGTELLRYLLHLVVEYTHGLELSAAEEVGRDYAIAEILEGPPPQTLMDLHQAIRRLEWQLELTGLEAIGLHTVALDQLALVEHV